MEIADFKARLPAKKALIGFDYGSRRLGVAVSDPIKDDCLFLYHCLSPGLDKRRGGPAPDY